MTEVDPRIALALEQAAKVNNRYGQKTAFVGENPYATNAIPSPSLMFDFMSGLGGFPDNAPLEVYAPPSMGKTTIFGYSAIRNAQQMGKLTGIIALEPAYDEEWVIKNGINPDYNVVAYPDNLDEAFEIYHDWVFGGVVDYILFDSLVGATSEPDMEEGAKARPGGQAKTITWNLQRTVMRQAKNGVGSMFINQIRDDQKARIPGMVESPGGHALKHLALMRIQMKPGKERYTMKIDGQDQIVGREIVATFKKAKAHGALGKAARFDFYHIDTAGEYPFGVDVAKDVINTGMVSKVIESKGAWYYHSAFPKGKLNGKVAVGEFLASKPEVIETLRREVLDVMVARKEQNAKDELKAVSG
jgi:recombination protein RecA